jgi:hypothetical protein
VHFRHNGPCHIRLSLSLSTTDFGSIWKELRRSGVDYSSAEPGSYVSRLGLGVRGRLPGLDFNSSKLACTMSSNLILNPLQDSKSWHPQVRTRSFNPNPNLNLNPNPNTNPNPQSSTLSPL